MEFEGDLFGNAADYDDDNFGQLQDVNPVAAEPDNFPQGVGGLAAPAEEHGNDDEGSDEDEVIMAEVEAELEAGWELPRPDAPLDHAVPNADATDPEEMWALEFLDEVEKRRQADPVLIGDGSGLIPKFTQRYSEKHRRSQAGQPVGYRQSADNAYTDCVDGAENPYAPFNSKLDWEVAKWAKLRGSGSTAFSELLAIDGVSPFMVFIVHLILIMFVL